MEVCSEVFVLVFMASPDSAGSSSVQPEGCQPGHTATALRSVHLSGGLVAATCIPKRPTDHAVLVPRCWVPGWPAGL